jgi:phosphoglycerate dehydrogenase-like enzyme
MKNDVPIAVASRSFSRHPILRKELLDSYSNVRFNDAGTALEGPQLIEFAHGRTKLITALEEVDEAFLAALPELKVIGKYGVGTDMLDKQAMARHGVRLGWQGGVNRRSVSELALGFMLSMLRDTPLLNREIRDGVWKSRKGRSLSERTVGIIGCGHIGKDLTGLLKPFGCNILVNDILDMTGFCAANGAAQVSLAELLGAADVVTLHVPLDDSTRNILNVEHLALMKPDALLINTARGGLVDEDALKAMLRTGRLAGAALDVFAVEPPTDRDLLALPNFYSTPHIGGSSEEGILAMGRAAIRGLDVNELPFGDAPVPDDLKIAVNENQSI